MLINPLYLLLISLVQIVFSSTDGEQRIQEVVDACAIENNYAANKYSGFVYWDLNYKLDHCVLACAMKKLGTLSEDGVFTGAKTLKAIDKYPVSSPELKIIVLQCAEEYGTSSENDCERVKNIHNCLADYFMRMMHSTWTIYGSTNKMLLFTPETLP